MMPKAIVELTINPEDMAELFWNFSSEEQARFFIALADNGDQYKRQMQWWYLHDDLKEHANGKEALMDLAAPFYLHVLRE